VAVMPHAYTEDQSRWFRRRSAASLARRDKDIHPLSRYMLTPAQPRGPGSVPCQVPTPEVSALVRRLTHLDV
jgi:hypothetical protein